MKTSKAAIWLLAMLTGASYLACNGQKNNCVVEAGSVANVDSVETIVIDVRTPGEYAEAHVPGALLININGTDFSKEIAKLDTAKQYYVYCRSGVRSARAQRTMQKQGFTKVCNVEGGILKMEKEGVKLTK